MDIESNTRGIEKQNSGCSNCKGVGVCIHANTHKDHWMTWPSNWEHTSDIRKPLFNLFHPTGVSSYNPDTNLFHWWQSRANRKQVPHRQNYRSNKELPWWTNFYSWKPGVFAWWVALSFTFGSMIFVALAAVLLNPKLASQPITSQFLGIFALFGAFIFVIGGTCQVLEILQAPLVITSPHFDNLSRSLSIEHSNSLELQMLRAVAPVATPGTGAG
jgi:hypothetical protein